MQCAPEATEFGEITHNKGHYAVIEDVVVKEFTFAISSPDEFLA